MSEESSFLSHLVEVRKRVIRSVIAIVLLFFALFPFSGHLFTLLAQPLLAQLPSGRELIAINLTSPVFVPLKLTLFIALCLSIPYLLYQAWSFIAPGLYVKEQKIAWFLLVFSSALFYIGLLFAYFLVLPLIFNFFINYAPAGVALTPDIDQFFSFCIKLFFAFGLAFQVPIAAIILVYSGVVTIAQLRNARPYVIVAIFTLGMLLTPPDVLSQIILSVPVCILYELGIVLAKVLTKDA